MAYEVHFRGNAAEELQEFRVFERRRIVDEINSQLVHEPTLEARNRKPLLGVTPRFEHRPPVWELRTGDIRIFYDVDEATKEVNVRAIRRKRQGQTTEDIT